MRIFLDPFHAILNEKKEKLETILKQFGVQVVYEVDIEDTKADRIHAFFLDTQTDKPENAFISSLAIAKKKSIVCFIPKGKQLPSSLSLLNTNPVLKKKIRLVFYTPKNLNKVVSALINQLDSGALREKPSVKFTLRITPSMERYLEWKSSQLGESKADFLRNAIDQQIISKDTDYNEMVE